MFGKQMTALQTRKKALMLESDLNRLRLLAEVNNLREIGGFAKKFKHLARFGRWAWVLAPLAGVIATLGLGRTSMVAGALRKGLATAPALIRLWRMVSALFAEFK